MAMSFASTAPCRSSPAVANDSLYLVQNLPVGVTWTRGLAGGDACSSPHSNISDTRNRTWEGTPRFGYGSSGYGHPFSGAPHDIDPDTTYKISHVSDYTVHDTTSTSDGNSHSVNYVSMPGATFWMALFDDLLRCDNSLQKYYMIHETCKQLDALSTTTAAGPAKQQIWGGGRPEDGYAWIPPGGGGGGMHLGRPSYYPSASDPPLSKGDIFGYAVDFPAFASPHTWRAFQQGLGTAVTAAPGATAFSVNTVTGRTHSVSTAVDRGGAYAFPSNTARTITSSGKKTRALDVAAPMGSRGHHGQAAPAKLNKRRTPSSLSQQEREKEKKTQQRLVKLQWLYGPNIKCFNDALIKEAEGYKKQKLKREGKAARTIQQFWRGYLQRKRRQQQQLLRDSEEQQREKSGGAVQQETDTEKQQQQREAKSTEEDISQNRRSSREPSGRQDRETEAPVVRRRSATVRRQLSQQKEQQRRKTVDGKLQQTSEGRQHHQGSSNKNALRHSVSEKQERAKKSRNAADDGENVFGTAERGGAHHGAEAEGTPGASTASADKQNIPRRSHTETDDWQPRRQHQHERQPSPLAQKEQSLSSLTRHRGSRGGAPQTEVHGRPNVTTVWTTDSASVRIQSAWRGWCVRRIILFEYQRATLFPYGGAAAIGTTAATFATVSLTAVPQFPPERAIHEGVVAGATQRSPLQFGTLLRDPRRPAEGSGAPPSLLSMPLVATLTNNNTSSVAVPSGDYLSAHEAEAASNSIITAVENHSDHHGKVALKKQQWKHLLHKTDHLQCRSLLMRCMYRMQPLFQLQLLLELKLHAQTTGNAVASSGDSRPQQTLTPTPFPLTLSPYSTTSLLIHPVAATLLGGRGSTYRNAATAAARSVKCCTLLSREISGIAVEILTKRQGIQELSSFLSTCKTPPASEFQAASQAAEPQKPPIQGMPLEAHHFLVFEQKQQEGDATPDHPAGGQYPPKHIGGGASGIMPLSSSITKRRSSSSLIKSGSASRRSSEDDKKRGTLILARPKERKEAPTHLQKQSLASDLSGGRGDKYIELPVSISPPSGSPHERRSSLQEDRQQGELQPIPPSAASAAFFPAKRRSASKGEGTTAATAATPSEVAAAAAVAPATAPKKTIITKGETRLALAKSVTDEERVAGVMIDKGEGALETDTKTMEQQRKTQGDSGALQTIESAARRLQEIRRKSAEELLLTQELAEKRRRSFVQSKASSVGASPRSSLMQHTLLQPIGAGRSPSRHSSDMERRGSLSNHEIASSRSSSGQTSMRSSSTIRSSSAPAERVGDILPTGGESVRKSEEALHLKAAGVPEPPSPVAAAPAAESRNERQASPDAKKKLLRILATNEQALACRAEEQRVALLLEKRRKQSVLSPRPRSEPSSATDTSVCSASTPGVAAGDGATRPAAAAAAASSAVSASALLSGAPNGEAAALSSPERQVTAVSAVVTPKPMEMFVPDRKVGPIPRQQQQQEEEGVLHLHNEHVMLKQEDKSEAMVQQERSEGEGGERQDTVYETPLKEETQQQEPIQQEHKLLQPPQEKTRSEKQQTESPRDRRDRLCRAAAARRQAAIQQTALFTERQQARLRARRQQQQQEPRSSTSSTLGREDEQVQFSIPENDVALAGRKAFTPIIEDSKFGVKRCYTLYDAKKNVGVVNADTARYPSNSPRDGGIEGRISISGEAVGDNKGPGETPENKSSSDILAFGLQQPQQEQRVRSPRREEEVVRLARQQLIRPPPQRRSSSAQRVTEKSCTAVLASKQRPPQGAQPAGNQNASVHTTDGPSPIVKYKTPAVGSRAPAAVTLATDAPLYQLSVAVTDSSQFTGDAHKAEAIGGLHGEIGSWEDDRQQSQHHHESYDQRRLPSAATENGMPARSTARRKSSHNGMHPHSSGGGFKEHFLPRIVLHLPSRHMSSSSLSSGGSRDSLSSTSSKEEEDDNDREASPARNSRITAAQDSSVFNKRPQEGRTRTQGGLRLPAPPEEGGYNSLAKNRRAVETAFARV